MSTMFHINGSRGGLICLTLIATIISPTSGSHDNEVVRLAFFTDFDNVTDVNTTLFELDLVAALGNGGVPSDDIDEISVATVLHRDASVVIHANVSTTESALLNMTILGEDGVNITYNDLTISGYAVSEIYMIFSISFEDINSTAFKISILDAVDSLGIPSTYVMGVSLFAGSVVAQASVSAENGYADSVLDAVSNGNIAVEYNGNSYTAASTTTTFSTTVTSTPTTTATTTPDVTTIGPTMPSRDVPFASEGLELTKNKLLVAAAFAGAAGTLALLVLTVAQIRYTFYGYHRLKVSASASRLHDDADDANAPLLRSHSSWSLGEPGGDDDAKSGMYGSVIASTDIDSVYSQQSSQSDSTIDHEATTDLQSTSTRSSPAGHVSMSTEVGSPSHVLIELSPNNSTVVQDDEVASDHMGQPVDSDQGNYIHLENVDGSFDLEEL
eukprot:m.126928 g.126928  ORF g.126928 m.126928 type:complete len:442 (-) comp17399_c0_seq1:255-1580(-)